MVILAAVKNVRNYGELPKYRVEDAHEAIRPTSNHRTPDSIRKYLSPDQYNLYKLIYNRTLASLMKPKKEEITKIVLEGNEQQFSLEFTRTIFNGYFLHYLYYRSS